MAEGVVDQHVPQWLSLEPSSAREFGPDDVNGVRWRPTAEELDAICESHRKWIESNGKDGQKADLSRTFLRDADLSGAILRDADLSEADLRYTNLSDAELRDADLSEVDLSKADLPGAVLWSADLSGAYLSFADLSGASPSLADLSEANLFKADLSGADLRHTNLSDAELRNADLSDATLGGADLSGALFSNADLSEASLFSADLSDADLRDADLSEVDLSKADLPGADLRYTNLSDAELRNANLSDATLGGADLLEADLRRTDLSKADLNDADLTGVDGLQVGQLRGATVSLADLPDAVKDFAGLDIAEATTRSAKKLFISVLIACAYAALAIALKTGRSEDIELPIIGLSIGTQPFYLVTPVLLALLFGYFHLQMQRLWEELAQLPAIFPDGKPLDEKVHPWLVTGLVRAHTKRLKERRAPSFFPLQRVVAVLLAWGTVPITLLTFAWMYPPGSTDGTSLYRWTSLYLFLLTALTASGAIAAYRRARDTLRLEKRQPLQLRKPASVEDSVWFLKSAGLWIGVECVLVAFVLWYLRLGVPFF